MQKKVTFIPLLSRTLAFSISLISAVTFTNLFIDNQILNSRIVNQYTCTKAKAPARIDPPTIAASISTERLHDLSLLRKLFYNTNASATRVPDNIKNLMPYYKTQLRELITDTINKPANQKKPLAQINDELISALQAYNIPVNEEANYPTTDWETSNQIYGHIYQINMELPKDHHDLLVVKTKLAVMCGEDSSLYLFKKVDQQWQLILSHESNGYNEVSGAMGDLQYAILKDRTKYTNHKIEDLPVIVVADVNPWCSSNWQLLRYKVLRASVESTKPTVLSQDEESIYIGVSAPIFQLKSQDNSFSLQFEGDHEDPDMFTKERIINFQLSGNELVKLSYW